MTGGWKEHSKPDTLQKPLKISNWTWLSDMFLVFQFKISQILKSFENLVSKCEAARKIWLIKTFFFSQKTIRKELSNTARKCQLYCFYSVRRSREIVLLKPLLQWTLIFRKKFSFKIWSIVKYSIQILKDSKKFSSKSDMLYKFWF